MALTTRTILGLNRFDPVAAGASGGPPNSSLARRLAHFGSAAVLFYDEPIEMARGAGVHLFDTAGRRYLDVYNNVPSIGHCHPRVVAAIADQAGRLNHHTRYLNAVVEGYAERLLSLFPAPLAHLVLTCTGSESNDLALRLAEAATGRSGFVVTEAAYHGNTAAVAAISPASLGGRALAPHVRAIPAPLPDAGGGAGPTGGDDAGRRFAADLATAIDDLEAAGIGFAGLILDTILSSDGVHADPPGFLAPAAALARARGGLVVADEVQPGFGRTGAPGFWGFSRHGIVPDIVTLGKPMGNGFPMGGLVTRPELLAAFSRGAEYFNTFGGNPVAAAAGLAVLDAIADEGLVANAARVGAELKVALEAFAGGRDDLGAVRGAGLFIGLDVHDPATGAPDGARAAALINALRREGVLIGAAGRFGHTLKIRPPLCFAPADAETFLSALGRVLGPS